MSTSLFKCKFLPVATFITSVSTGAAIREVLNMGKRKNVNHIISPGDNNGGKNNNEAKSWAKQRVRHEHNRNWKLFRMFIM